MAEAGLTLLEAPKIATLNATQYLKDISEIDTVEEGKHNDMVRLEANPLNYIDNTNRIRALIA